MSFCQFKKIASLLFCLAIVIVFACSCNKDEYNTDPSAELSFSLPNVTFDTVFTSLGSVTKKVLVHNNSSDILRIESVRLAGGKSSPFRLNVDGDISEVAKDIEIAGKDSMYIFITVTINPNDANNPFLVQDSIEFYFNNRKQYYQLTAYGQNAIYHTPKAGDSVSYAEGTWDADKPHIVFGKCVVQSSKELTIASGTKIYFGNKSSLTVQKNAKLIANGYSINEKIYFQSVRLDKQYYDLPGQWDGIFFESGSTENKLDWVVIKNGKIGIYVDSLSGISIKNAIIENMSNIGIYAKQASIENSGNLLVANCQNNLLYFINGGTYHIVQSTFANYWSYGLPRQVPSLYLSANKSSNGNAYFGNCIVYGSNAEEVSLNFDSTNVSYTFDGCLLKTTKINNNNNNIVSCLFNQDPEFRNTIENDYHLGSTSAAIEKGRPNNILEFDYDLDNVNRNGAKPSIGCYEYKP